MTLLRLLFFTIPVAVGSIAFPFLAYAQEPLRDPLNYPLRVYGLILAIAMLGGIVAWFRRVKKGEAKMSVAELIGELTASAFAGLIAFWICEAFNVNPLLTAAIAGMSGHAGSSALVWIERLGKRHIAKRFGLEDPDSERGSLEQK